MDFFIADTHFFDNNIIKYENRPFSNSEEMLGIIADNWNMTVGQDDRVFVLGDFADVSKRSEILLNSGTLRSLKGRKYLIRGNHDTENDEFYVGCGFEKVYDFPIVLDGFWILSHEPLYVNSNMPYANIYGHVHGNDMYKDYSKHSFCVSVERIEYTPVSFERIKNAVAAHG